MVKVCIAGSRDWNNYEQLEEMMDKVLETYHINSIECIISGTAYGGDKLGEKWANNHNIPIKQFPADWFKHGKKAGYLRNLEMADIADILVICIKRKSKGSTHMAKTMADMGKPVYLLQLDY